MEEAKTMLLSYYLAPLYPPPPPLTSARIGRLLYAIHRKEKHLKIGEDDTVIAGGPKGIKQYVPEFLSSCLNWFPHPLPRKRMCLPPRPKRVGDPIQTAGQKVWYSIQYRIP
jgi:hypothetical protein